MKHRLGASALPRVLCFLGVLWVGANSGCSRAQRRGPVLSIVRRDKTTDVRDAVPPGSMALALGGLPPEELTRLRERLDEWTDAAVRRAAPMLYDPMGLSEDEATPESDPLRQVLPDVPAMTAAANVLGAPWKGPGISVTLGPSCDAAAVRCMQLFAPSVDRSDALVRSGRALAWTLANAALLHVPANSRVALLRSLREAQARASGTIALVFGASRGLLDEVEVEQLRERAGRALAYLPPDAPQRPWLVALGAAPASWELPVGLDTDEVLVVPRLSALARLQVFQAEINLSRRPAH